jgi:hypothetical protein
MTYQERKAAGQVARVAKETVPHPMTGVERLCCVVEYRDPAAVEEMPVDAVDAQIALYRSQGKDDLAADLALIRADCEAA